MRLRSSVRYTTRLSHVAMAAHGKIRTNLEYLLTRALVGFFSLLPLRSAISLGSSIGRVGLWFPKLRRTGERNLEIAFPELSFDDRRKLLKGCFESLGRLLGIFPHFKKESTESWRQVIDCQGLDQLASLRAEGRGIILFTGHVGAWELTSFALSLFDQPLSFLVRRIDNPKIEAYVDSYRTCRGNRTIDKMFAAREMLQLLQRGGTLGILVDLNTLEREAVFVDFFGIKAATTFTVAKLALRTGAAVVPVFAPWDDAKKKFVVRIDEPISFEHSENEDENILRLTQAFTSVVESYVRQYPDQWLWIHRRWRTRPQAEPDLYG